MQLRATEADMTAIADLVYELCGICISDSKSYLVESRLSDLVQSSGSESYLALAHKAKQILNQELRREIVDRMTTNETLFFRDRTPFDALQHKIIPELLDARESTLYPKRLRIWSAACSTGQEPYSIGMTLAELIPDYADWDIQILATDISDQVIKAASSGTYSTHHIDRGLPPNYKSKYFTSTPQGWQIKDSIRSMVSFKKLNLMDPLPLASKYDVIFCRNVAIYFSEKDRRELFAKIAKTLAQDGCLIVGSAEALGDLRDHFRPEQHCRATVYRHRDFVNLPVPT